MTKKSLKRYWISSISACCITAGIALACAGDSGPEYGTSNFSPYVAKIDTSYHPFFFSNMFYYGIGYDNAHDTRFNNANTREWATYFGQDIPVSELDFLLQHAELKTIDSAIAWTASPTSVLPPRIKDFKLLANPKKLSAFLKYLTIAKLSESFALNNYASNWDYNKEEKDKHPNDIANVLDLCQKSMKGVDPFIAERYLFQMERAYFFNGRLQEVVNIFQTLEKEFKPGTIYYRSMAYAAGALYKLKNFTKANYLYSKVFANCPELRTVAHFSFHPQEEADWRATLALCHDKEEAATLWQMMGIFYSDEQRSIKEIYKLDPGSEKLELLMIRAVNLYEQKFNGGNDYDTRRLPDSSASTLPALVTRIATEGRSAHPWIWDMAAGYLNTLDEHYSSALPWYDKTASLMPKETLPQWQLRLLRFINTVGMTRQMDKHAEKELLPDLQWLSDKTNKEDFGLLRTDDAFEWSRKRIAALYVKQNDPVKAECFVRTSRFYADDKRTATLKAFLDKPDKTPYEQFCARLSFIRSEDINEYQAIKSGMAGQLDTAIILMKKNAIAAKTVLLGNPFNGRIQDCHDCDFSAPQKIKYTKLSFLEKLKELKDKVAAGTDVYTNSVLLGNAFYNMSDFGNARVFYECSVIGSGIGIDSVFDNIIYNMALSRSYYTQALNAAVSDEQKAKCQYSLAKCERNDWYTNVYPHGNNGPDFIAWKGFAALRNYSSTQYYKDVIRECGYFRTYIKKHP